MTSPYLKIHRLLRRLQQKNRFVGRVAHSGLTPIETHFLIELQADPSRDLKNLSSLLGIDQSFGSRVGKALHQKGMLLAKPDRHDKRRKGLSITKKGDSVISVVDIRANELIENFSRGLSKTEQQSVVDLFRRIADGYGHPAGIRRKHETPYRVEQRRLTRCMGLIGEDVFGSGLSSLSWQTLAEIVLSPIPIQPTELALLLGVAQNSVSTVLGSLEKRGFIRRNVNSRDRRSSTLQPLSAGIHFYRSIEERAEREIQKALGQGSKSKIQRDADVLAKFVGEEDAILPPLLPGYQLKKLEDVATVRQARGFVLRTLVALEYEEHAPETILAEKNELFGLWQEHDLVAVVEVSSVSKKVVLASWQKEITPWILLGLIGKIHMLARPHTSLQVKDFVSFLPLRQILSSER